MSDIGTRAWLCSAQVPAKTNSVRPAPRVAPQGLRGLAEGAQERSSHAFGVNEARFGRDFVHRVAALLDQHASGLHAQALHRLRRGLPGFFAERATELTRAEMCGLGQFFNRQGGAQVATRKGQRILDAIGPGIQLEQHRMLGLPASTAVVDHQLPGHRPGQLRPEVVLDHAKRQVQPRAHAGGSPDRAIGDEDAIFLHLRGGKALLERTGVEPVRGGAPPVQQPRLAKNEGACAHRRGPARARAPLADQFDQRAGGRGWLQQAGHDQSIQRLLRQRRRLHGHAKRAGHQPALFGEHVQIVKARAFGGIGQFEGGRSRDRHGLEPGWQNKSNTEHGGFSGVAVNEVYTTFTPFTSRPRFGPDPGDARRFGLTTVNNPTPQGTALITGASSGIGAIYADRLARAGHDLILVARRGDRLRQLAEALARSTGRAVDIVAADLTTSVGLAEVESVIRGRADIRLLVNNAGIGATAPLLQSDIGEMERMITLNVNAAVRLAYAAAPVFVAHGQGTIINIASIVALAPELLNGVYAGSKAFVLAFSQSLHHELADKGVRVQVVLPGATATDFWHLSGLPVEHLPQGIVMSAEDMVDASLAGLAQGERVTIPALPDIAEWDAFEHARKAMAPGLSRAQPAQRYMSRV